MIMFSYFMMMVVIGFVVGFPCGMFFKFKNKKDIVFFVATKPDLFIALKCKMFRHIENAVKERDSANKFLDVARDVKYKLYMMNLTDIREVEFYGN